MTRRAQDGGTKGGGAKDGAEIANVRVGKPQARPTASSHTPGVRRGNARRGADGDAGLIPQPDGAHATARRSTGINPKARDPIDPRMPNLPPA